MEFKEMGFYNPDALYAMQEVQPLEFALLSPINRLNYLIGFLKKKKPEIVDDFIKKLEEKYKKLATKEYVESSEFDIKSILSDFSNLKEFPDLAKDSLNLFLNLLEVDLDSDWSKDKLKVSQQNHLISFLGPKYFNIEVLSTVIEREAAIQLYKNYITEFMIDYYKDKADNVDDLDALWEKYFTIEDENRSQHRFVVQSKPNKGKMIFRKEVCLWDDALKEFPDTEFKYLVCCYGDFQGAKRENKHFILTMEHTIVKGDPYCSCIFHDTRIDWDLKHPPKDYWDNIWPLHEWQKK
ncbi:MAG: L-2-amino-thiazoline-4-carboxylic acid hydrolase [Candidatus Heimdallarchaeaceae archaeon]